MDGYLLGLDFGTCNIKVSYYNENRQKVDALKIDKNDGNADKNVANIIYYKNRTEYQVGATAKHATAYDEENSVDLIKRKLELESWSYSFDTLGFTVSAIDVATDIFIWIRKEIENQGKRIAQTIVTVPVCFTEISKKRIVDSAKQAGLPVLGIVTEPVAALFSLEELFEEECEERVVIFDFGGATLDLCLCEVRNDGAGSIEIQVEASAGIDFGGVDITELLYQEVVYPKYRKELDTELRQDTLHRMKKSFLQDTDRLKTGLFGEEEEEYEEYFDMPYSSRSLEVVLTLEEALHCLEKHKIKEKIIAALDALFEDSEEIEKEDVTMVKAFGGTSRILYFREILEEYFGSDIYESEDYELDEAYRAVADGAARYLGLLLEEDNDVSISNSVPYYIGIDKNGTFKPVVKRNQKYGVFTPYKNLREIQTGKDEWKLVLYQAFSSEQEISAQKEEGAVYLGDLYLTEELYRDAGEILYKFGVTKEGKIVGRFFGTTKNNDIFLIEEKEIVIGG